MLSLRAFLDYAETTRTEPLVSWKMASLALLVVLLVASGAIAGVLSGLLGVGGGIVLVPAFYYVFSSLGYQSDHLMQVCVATSTGTIILTSLRAVLAHHKRGAVSLSLMRTWGPFILMSAVLGVFAAASLRSQQLQLVFSVLAMVAGLYMLMGKSDWHLSTQLPRGLYRGLYASLIGFFSALMGIGGGIFSVPLLTAHSLPPRKAVATSSGFGLMISLPAFVTFSLSGWQVAEKPPLTIGYVNFPALTIVIATTMLTVPIGVKIAHALSPQKIRLIFACTLLLLTSSMLGKTLIE